MSRAWNLTRWVLILAVLWPAAFVAMTGLFGTPA